MQPLNIFHYNQLKVYILKYLFQLLEFGLRAQLNPMKPVSLCRTKHPPAPSEAAIKAASKGTATKVG